MMPKGPPPHQFRIFGFLNFGPPVVQFLIVFIFSLMLKMNERLKRTERERAIAELSYLKAQINPHFLFNSLNSIYALALEKSDLAAAAVIKLSGIMRYIINEADKDEVILQKEIDYLQDYIDLQKFRLENTVQLTFTTEGIFDKHYIAPLLLIPFIENTFKYGVNPEEISVIHIGIANDNGHFQLKTFNKKVTTQKYDTVTPKLGLSNTRKRLESLYPANYSLEIDEDDATYTVKLNINLT